MVEKAEGNKKKKENSLDSFSGPVSLIFISHDARDAELAESFSKVLSSVSCGVLM